MSVTTTYFEEFERELTSLEMQYKEEDSVLQEVSSAYLHYLDDYRKLLALYNQGLEDPGHFDVAMLYAAYAALNQHAAMDIVLCKDMDFIEAHDITLGTLYFLEACYHDNYSSWEEKLAIGITQQALKVTTSSKPANMSKEKEVFTALSEEFSRIDTAFHRPPSEEYKNFEHALSNLPGKLSRLKGAKTGMHHLAYIELNEVYKAGQALLLSYQNSEKFDQRDVQRLKVANRVLDMVEYNRQTALRGEIDFLEDSLDHRLAAKIADSYALALGAKSDNASFDRMTELLTDRVIRGKSISAILKHPAYQEMIDLRSKSSVISSLRPRENFLEESDAGVLKSFIRAKASLKDRLLTEHQQQMQLEERQRELAMLARNKKENALSGENSKLDSLQEQYIRGLSTIKRELQRMEVKEDKHSELDTTAISKVLALEIIYAERADINGTDYLDKTAIQAGELEQWLDIIGGKAFCDAVNQHPVTRLLLDSKTNTVRASFLKLAVSDEGLQKVTACFFGPNGKGASKKLIEIAKKAAR